MVSEKISIIVNIGELSFTISEALLYIYENNSKDVILDDIVYGINTIKNSLKRENLFNEDLRNLFKKFEKNKLIYLNNKKLLLDFQELFRYNLDVVISNSLLNEINNRKGYINFDDSEILFEYCNKILIEREVNFHLIFNLCNKTAISNPKKSFEFSIKLFEKQPGFLSSEENLHKGYIYKYSNQRTFEKCPVCGGDGIPFFRAFSYLINTFSYPHLPVKLWNKCNNCKNLYTWKFSEDFLQLSNQSRIVYPDGNDNFDIVQNADSNVLFRWSSILNNINRNYTKGREVLEVGVGKGEFTAVALEMNYNIDAVEIIPEEAQKIANLLNIPVYNVDFLNFSLDKKYSIIIMGDVIEHVTNPIEALKKAYNLLKEDGVLWLSTPNYNSAFTRLLKFQDPMFKEPYHITYFSYEGLKKIIEECGFKVVEYNCSNRYNGSMELIIIKK